MQLTFSHSRFRHKASTGNHLYIDFIYVVLCVFSVLSEVQSKHFLKKKSVQNTSIFVSVNTGDSNYLNLQDFSSETSIVCGCKTFYVNTQVCQLQLI